MAEIAEQLGNSASGHAAQTHAVGVALVDEPLAAGGVRIAAVLPDVDLRQLAAIRTFMVDRLKNVTQEVATKIRNNIGLVLVGAATPFDVITSVSGVIEGGKGRAQTIVRTELGRAFSVATHERMAQAKEVLPGLKKQWRRSGKVHSRRAHDLADGQIVDVGKPFTVNGYKLMYPRDPKGPAKETINCGCVELPIMEDWTVSQSGRQAFSDQEVFINPAKRDLAQELNPPIAASEPGQILVRSVEAMSDAEARKAVKGQVASDEFATFVRLTGGRDHRPVAVIDPTLREALGTETKVARLSTYTAVKQRAHRKGQKFTAADYQLIQHIIDEGTIIREDARNLIGYAEIKGKVWKLALKAIGQSNEVFVTSLHRSKRSKLRKTKTSSDLVRDGRS
jgi:hypothetical protein